MDLSPAKSSVRELYELLDLANKRLIIGHFEIFPTEGVPAFRYSFLIPTLKSFYGELLEEAIELTLNECERFYPAFQFVMLGEKKAKEAASIVMMETVGEA
jgi:hypothetical protein